MQPAHPHILNQVKQLNTKTKLVCMDEYLPRMLHEQPKVLISDKGPFWSDNVIVFACVLDFILTFNFRNKLGVQDALALS
jgi:hypothetical protein